MRNSYHDKELNRLLAEADELLSDVNLNLYETPAEEQARKQAEAARRQAEEDRKRAAAEAEAQARRQAEEDRKRAAIEAEEQARRQAEEAARRAAAEAEVQARRQAEEAARRAAAEAEAEAEAVRRQVAIEVAETARRQAEEAAHRQTEPVKETSVAEVSVEETATAESVAEPEQAGKKRRVNVLRDSVWGTVCYAALTMIYMEVILHLAVYDTMDTNVFQSAAFAAAAGCIIVLAVSWLPEKVNHIVCMILLILGCGWFDFQIISRSWNESYALLNMDIGYPLQVLKNIVPALKSTGADMVWVVLMFVPVILFGIFGRKLLPLRRAGWMNRVLMGLAGVLLVVMGFLCIEAHGAGEGTPYETVRRFDSNVDQEQAVEQMGITGTILLEGMEVFR